MDAIESWAEWEAVCMAPAELKLASIDAKLKSAEHAFFWHSHPFFECGLVLEGKCRWHVGASSYDLAEGEVIIVPQGVAHMEQVFTAERARLSWVGFVSAAVAGQQGEQLNVLTALDGLPARIGASRSHTQPMSEADAFTGGREAGGLQPLKIPTGRWSADIRRLFVTIYDEQSESGFGAEMRISLCLRELLLLLMRSVQGGAEEERQVVGSGADMLLRQTQLAHAASRYFDNNTEQGVTIQSVARYFRLTPQYFSTLFRKVHGISPARYQQAARLRLAARLLLGSQRSIKEIAALCGYADSPHFCRQFKAHKGCSPAEYRLRKVAKRKQ